MDSDPEDAGGDGLSSHGETVNSHGEAPAASPSAESPPEAPAAAAADGDRPAADTDEKPDGDAQQALSGAVAPATSPAQSPGQIMSPAPEAAAGSPVAPRHQQQAPAPASAASPAPAHDRSPSPSPSPLPSPGRGTSSSPSRSPPSPRPPSRDEALAQSTAERALLGATAAPLQPGLKAAAGELRARVAALELRLERALRAREAAEGQLRAAEAQAERDRAFWEERAADRDAEAALLRSKLAALRAAGPGAGPGEGAAGPGPGEAGAEDAALLSGYQAENEAAMRRIKDLEQQLARARAAAAAEAGRAERHLAAAEDQERERGRGAQAAERLRKLLDTQSELQAAREASERREGELRDQITRLRQQKRDLEARLGGVDLRQMQEGDALVAAVRSEISDLAARHAEQVAALEERLAWYSHNQQEAQDNDRLVAEQASTIRQLRARLAALESPSGLSHRKQVEELEGQVEALRHALAARHPNSLPAVLAAARPPPGEGRLVRQLQEEAEGLRARVREGQREHERALRALQQQYEQLKARAARSREGGGERREATNRGGPRGQAEHERRLEELRAHYSRRIRTLEARAASAEARAAGGAGGGGAGAPPSAAPEAAAAPEGRGAGDDVSGRRGRWGEGSGVDAGRDDDDGGGGAALQAVEVEVLVARRDKQVAELQRRLRAAERLVEQLQQQQEQQQQQLQQQERPGARAAVAEAHQAEACQRALIPSEDERSHVAKVLSSRQHPHASLEQQQQQQQREQTTTELAATQGALAALQQAHEELLERCAALGAEAWRHAAADLGGELAARKEAWWGRRLGELEQALVLAHRRNDDLEVALAVAEGSAGPSARAFIALERRLGRMSEDLARSEAAWRSVISEAERASEAEAALARRRHEAELAARDAIIAGFSGEVEGLLRVARALQLRPAP